MCVTKPSTISGTISRPQFCIGFYGEFLSAFQLYFLLIFFALCRSFFIHSTTIGGHALGHLCLALSLSLFETCSVTAFLCPLIFPPPLARYWPVNKAFNLQYVLLMSSKKRQGEGEKRRDGWNSRYKTKPNWNPLFNFFALLLFFFLFWIPLIKGYNQFDHMLVTHKLNLSVIWLFFRTNNRSSSNIKTIKTDWLSLHTPL